MNLNRPARIEKGAISPRSGPDLLRSDRLLRLGPPALGGLGDPRSSRRANIPLLLNACFSRGRNFSGEPLLSARTLVQLRFGRTNQQGTGLLQMGDFAIDLGKNF